MEQGKIRNYKEETICAIATPPGKGGIAVIRISGPQALKVIPDEKREQLKPRKSYLRNYKSIEGEILDEVLLTYFKAPNSFTGEDTVEISMHGSTWIQREILSDLIKRGIRLAEAGEFTKRAFLNGRMDLASAEGVADLISSESRAAHKIALSQMKGLFSNELEILREKLLEFASLMELELDFSEEDVEFAERHQLKELANSILKKVTDLAATFKSGKAIKEGVPVVIAGMPNAGKSSLLNLLVQEEKAIVTEIPGTTRDIIEDKIELDGILYRITDTAGLRVTSDKIEAIGVERARKALRKAMIVIWMIDSTSPLPPQLEELDTYISSDPESKIILLNNKSDLISKDDSKRLKEIEKIKDIDITIITFSTKTGEGLQQLLSRLNQISTEDISMSDIVISNIRHYEALIKGAEALKRAINGLESGLSGDFISQDIRETLHHLGRITGAISTPDILQSIFSRFCIGK